MQEDLRLQVIARLERDYGLKQRPQTEYMRGGKCPTCGKKELYTNHLKPWVLRCGRQAKCGREVSVKEVYSDLFEDWGKRFPTTEANPYAAAEAYLQHSRGFDLARVRGLFIQADYYNVELRQGSTTVRFPLVRGGWWERLIDRPNRFGKMKARFAPGQSFAGCWWAAPEAIEKMKDCAEVWIVEGIFDAIALMHHGHVAVSAMSDNQFPAESLRDLVKLRQGRLPTLIWAPDNQPGSRAYMQKHVARAKAMGFTCKAALIPQPADGRKVDWNDLHLRTLAHGAADEQRAHWDDEIKEARYQGDLELARSAVEKGLLIHNHDNRREFHLGFRSRLYWFEFDASRFEKIKAEHIKANGEDDLDDKLPELQRSAAFVREIANCYFEALYFQRNDLIDESWYFFKVDFPHDAPSVKGTFTASQTLNAPGFRDRLASFAPGAVFDGTASELIHVMKDQLFNIKKVETIDFVGYSKDHKAYLLGDVAVRDGALVLANEEDYFEFDKLRLKTTQKSIRMEIQQDDANYRTDWLPWLWLCFGTHGMIALTFWFGSLFAEQIRAAHKSFPFLEATGEAGAGKTTLLTFLWKLLGRSDYEGFDPSKSSKAGRARAMGQISGMPVVLLEADRNEPDKAHAKTFEWDELKDFFGGGTLATRGVRNGGNDTYEPPFRGTIVISQNAAVDASEAILTRIVKLHFKRPEVTTESRIAADNLNQLQVEELSHFLVKAIKAEALVLKTFADRVKHWEGALRERKEIRIERVIKNHAQMLALLDCLGLILDLPPVIVKDTRTALSQLAEDRQKAISADHPAVTQLWEVYEFLEGMHGKAMVNHSRDPKHIAINLNEFYARAAQYSQKLAEINDMRQLLRNSRRHKFLDASKAVNSAIREGALNKPATVKCWVFET